MVKEDEEVLKAECETCCDIGAWSDIKWFAQVTGEEGFQTVKVAVGKCLTCGVSQMLARKEL